MWDQIKNQNEYAGPPIPFQDRVLLPITWRTDKRRKRSTIDLSLSSVGVLVIDWYQQLIVKVIAIVIACFLPVHNGCRYCRLPVCMLNLACMNDRLMLCHIFIWANRKVSVKI